MFIRGVLMVYFLASLLAVSFYVIIRLVNKIEVLETSIFEEKITKDLESLYNKYVENEDEIECVRILQ
jgi:hypothetical protein